MYLIDELLDDSLLLLQQSPQLLHLLTLGLDVEVIGLLLHERVGALLATALLRLQSLLAPVAFEHALLEEGLLGPVFDQLPTLTVEVSRGTVIAPAAYFEGRSRPALTSQLLQLEVFVL